MKPSMTKCLVTACLVAAGLSGAFAFAAAAQDVPPPQAEVDARDEARAQAESEREDARTGEAEVDRNCLRYTGSRLSTRQLDEQLEREDKDCVIANGRVYTREDILRTGQTELSDALRMLDPAIY